MINHVMVVRAGVLMTAPVIVKGSPKLSWKRFHILTAEVTQLFGDESLWQMGVRSTCDALALTFLAVQQARAPSQYAALRCAALRRVSRLPHGE